MRVEKDIGQAEAMTMEAAEVLRRLNVESWTDFDAQGLVAFHHGRRADATAAFERARAIAQVERDHYREYQSLELLVVAALLRLLAHDGWVTSVAFSPDGERIASGSFDSTARVFLAVPR